MTQQVATPIPAEIPADIVEESQCMHYWVIQPATGPVSLGICQTCGENREFKNYVEGASWGDSRLSNRSTSEESAAVSRPQPNREDAEETEED